VLDNCCFRCNYHFGSFRYYSDNRCSDNFGFDFYFHFVANWLFADYWGDFVACLDCLA